MKTFIKITTVLSLFLVSCSSLQTTSTSDDLYYSPKDKIKSSNDVAYNQKYNKTDSYSENEEINNKISTILNDESKENIDTTVVINDDESGNPYQDIIVEDYSDAYDKRMEAKKSIYYGTNNYFITSTSDFWYASAYINDPFYNVIIVGDQVWVEPRWITSSFGYYNYYSPWYSRYYGYYGYNDYYGYYGYYNSPYYNYGYPYYNHYHPYYYPHYIINDNNNNWVISSSSSSRRRSLTTTNPTGIGRSQRASRQLPETYIGKDISRTRTLKDGLDQQGGTTSRRSDVIRDRNTDLSNERTTRVANSNVANDRINSETETVRRRTTTESSSANQAVTRTSRQGNSTNQTVTGTSRQGNSTYNTSNRTNNSRYVRPAKTSGEGTENVNRTSGSTTKSGSGGSSYSPTRSSGNSGSTVKSTPTRSSSGNSGSSRSSGSSGNSGSSKSSGSSSGSSNTNRGGRR